MTFGNRSLGNPFRFVTGNTLILAVTRALGNFARRMVLPYASLYILALGGNAAQIGLINSLRPLAGLIAFPIAGHIADYTGRVRVIALSNFLSVGIVAVFFLAPTWQVIAIGAALQGFVVLMFPARSALIADALPPGNRGRGIAAMNASMSALGMLAPLFAGVVIDLYGPNGGTRALYGAMLAPYLASTLVHLRFLQEPPRGTDAQPDHSSLPRETRRRVRAGLGQGGIMLGPAGGGTGGPSAGFVITIPLMLASLLGGVPVYGQSGLPLGLC